MKSILDPDFQYVPSHATDIRKTFQRVRERIQREKEALTAEYSVEYDPTYRYLSTIKGQENAT